jgi:nitroimidazol reductase NimA-like FMN-containing flavoprotein (pyridoxamine 5'-phosphate oxidase superfamily)
MTADIASNSAWSHGEIESYLSGTTLPCRLACTTADGYPHVMSLWYLYRDGQLWFSVQRNTKFTHWLSDNPRCGFEIANNEPPYVGVRGRGTATTVQAADDTVLRDLIERFLGDDNPGLANWLLSRTATEITLTVRPHWLTAWDYRTRMA